MQPKAIKKYSFNEVMAEAQRAADEFAKLPPDEQERVRAKQQAAFEQFRKAGGTQGVVFVAPRKED